MQLFPWNEDYEIGITEIDKQHRHLVGIINELSDAMIEQKGDEAVPQILEKLVDYIQLHFSTEEEVMHRGNYPALDTHSQEHHDMTREVLEFRKNYSRNHQVSPSELLGFLCEWLKNHILMSDKELGRFFKNPAHSLE
jgi:hemerythrin